MKRNVLFLLIALLSTLLLSVSCGGNQATDDASGKRDASQTQRQSITIKGSDTMVHLVSTWAEAFMEKNPDIDVSVTGGGSGTGIAALLNGTTDICAASRKIKDKETQLAEQKEITPVEKIVARDGIAVITNPENPVTELTLGQLKDIFTGTCTSWDGVGGQSENIVILSRENNSGTYVFFQKKVLQKEDYAGSARLMPATSAIVQSVTDDKWSIGYVGLGFALSAGEKVTVIKVKTSDDSEGVTPSEATVRSGDYPIARPLHLYTNGEPSGAVKSFIDFCISAEGQTIVQETGYVPAG
ncbi:phosphate ABC transporter substrate-binding protein [bacterium]|nr:phosphate ABC transporter substrate-binding protein [bacterium]